MEYKLDNLDHLQYLQVLGKQWLNFSVNQLNLSTTQSTEIIIISNSKNTPWRGTSMICIHLHQLWSPKMMHFTLGSFLGTQGSFKRNVSTISKWKFGALEMNRFLTLQDAWKNRQIWWSWRLKSPNPLKILMDLNKNRWTIEISIANLVKQTMDLQMWLGVCVFPKPSLIFQWWWNIPQTPFSGYGLVWNTRFHPFPMRSWVFHQLQRHGNGVSWWFACLHSQNNKKMASLYLKGKLVFQPSIFQGYVVSGRVILQNSKKYECFCGCWYLFWQVMRHAATI